MTTKPTIRELIDACRPDQHDPQRAELAADLAPLARELQQAELAEAAQRSQRFDRNVRSALDDVSLPAGLTERLLAKCEAAVVTPADPDAKDLEKISQPQRISRRQLLAYSSLAASALIVALAAYPAITFVLQPPAVVQPDELAQTSVRWFDSCGPGAPWSTVNASVLAQYPLDSALLFRPRSWRQVDQNTVAYNLSHGGKRAILFVHRPSRTHQVARTPYGSLPVSGGITLGSWQSQGVIYVLGVTGSNHSRPIDEFVKPVKAI